MIIHTRCELWAVNSTHPSFLQQFPGAEKPGLIDEALSKIENHPEIKVKDKTNKSSAGAGIDRTKPINQYKFAIVKVIE